MSRFDAIAQLLRRIEELERRHANQERHGKITDVDNKKGMVKVSDGVWTSGWLPWKEHNSNGGMKTRSMPKKDSQAVVKAMSGNLEIGTVSHSVYPSAKSTMPTADNGEHVTQMGDDDNDSNGQPNSNKKQVKTVTDASGNHDRTATNRHTTTVGDYSHSMTADGGHVFKAGSNFSYTMTKDGGHSIKAGGHTITLNTSGMQVDAPTAFSQNYGVGNGPGAITQIDNATPGSGI